MSAGGKKGKPKSAAHVGPNMTPMVDLVMCILIFYMLSSTFMMPELFLTNNMPAINKVGLGDEKTDTKMPEVRMSIKMVRKDNVTWVSAFESKLMKMNKIDDEDQSYNQAILAEFEGRRQGISPTVQIILKPERFVPYQDVITIYDFCARADYKQVAFAAPD